MLPLCHRGPDSDVESTQSRQKKGQMKSIFLSDSDEEAIVKFVKQHEELYDKTYAIFKDMQRKEVLWERLAASRNLSVNTVKKWFETWLQERFSFLKSDIRRKGLSKSFLFKSPL